MTLDNLAKKNGIKCLDTTKFYWRIYGYALKIAVPRKFILEKEVSLLEYHQRVKKSCGVLQTSSRASKSITSLKLFETIRPRYTEIVGSFSDKVAAYADDIIERNEALLGSEGFYYQSNNKNITLYLKERAVAEALILGNPRLFHTLVRPKSDSVEAFLATETNVEVKEREWFDKFDYRINFKHTGLDELDERVDMLNLSDSLYSMGAYSRLLYVKGEDDFFLVKLALSDQIDQVSRCVTRSSVECNFKSNYIQQV